MTLPLARHFDPDPAPDHDPDDPRCCACDDCDELAREQEAEEQGDWRRDDRVW